MDPLQVHKNGKIFLLLDTEIGAVGHIASMAILPAGALFQYGSNPFDLHNKGLCDELLRLNVIYDATVGKLKS